MSIYRIVKGIFYVTGTLCGLAALTLFATTILVDPLRKNTNP